MQRYNITDHTVDILKEGFVQTTHGYNHSDVPLTGSGGYRPQVGIISKSTLGILFLVNTVVIIFFISLAGSVLNLLNIIVFVKQGLKDPITITLLVLAISDFGSVFPLWIQSMFMILHFFPETFKEIDPRYLTAFLSWPHSVFVRVSCLLTVFIALERWICVTFPLQVNRIITNTVARVYNSVVASCLIATFVSLYCFSSIERMFLPQENRTLFVVTLTKAGREYAVKMSSIVTSVYLSTFALLVIFTFLTIMKLNQQSRWRQSMSSSSSNQMDAATMKTQKVVKMVVVICLLFILTTIPSVGNTLAFIFFDGYGERGRYHNLYTFISQLCFTLEVSNSTANFFIYFYMSSNYFATLNALLGLRQNAKGTEQPAKN